MLYSQHFLQYFHKNHIKILCRKLLLVLIWTHYWNYFFTHKYELIAIYYLKLLWKYCGSISQLRFFIFLYYFSFLSIHSHPYFFISFFLFLFSCFSPPHTCLTYLYPPHPFFYFLFLPHIEEHSSSSLSLSLSQQRREREKKRSNGDERKRRRSNEENERKKEIQMREK